MLSKKYSRTTVYNDSKFGRFLPLSEIKKIICFDNSPNCPRLSYGFTAAD